MKQANAQVRGPPPGDGLVFSTSPVASKDSPGFHLGCTLDPTGLCCRVQPEKIAAPHPVALDRDHTPEVSIPARRQSALLEPTEPDMDPERRVVFYQMALATIRAILLQQDPLDVPKLIELIDRLEAAAAEDSPPPARP